MEASKKRSITRARKKASLRKKISGIASHPRLSVFRSSKHIYAQAIDDQSGLTLASIATTEKEVLAQIKGHSGNKDSANVVGKLFGERLKSKGIESIVFDRNGFMYHGRVKSLADGIREAGVKF